MNKIILISAFIMLLFAQACTDLDETLYDKVTPDNYGKNEDEIATILGKAYATLRGNGNGTTRVLRYPTEYIWFINEVSSDEAVIPTRAGGHWNDGGVHLANQRHTWTTNHEHVLRTWEYLYGGIGMCMSVISIINNSSLDEDAKLKATAEVRGIRAYYYYRAMDYFGNIPIVTSDTASVLPKNTPRKDVFNYVEKELLEIYNYLPATGYGKFTKAVCSSVLARIYLNAEVYKGQAEWQKCIDACNLVTGYELETDIATNFLVKNEVSKENIFIIPFDYTTERIIGNYAQSLSLYYTQGLASDYTTTTVNGICGEPGVYKKFEDNDVRKNFFFFGDQINKKTGAVIITNEGNPLSYTDTIINITNATEYDGVRMHKYQIAKNNNFDYDNDWVIIRYSEILLMKAEALLRIGQEPAAWDLVNQIRTRAGLSATPSPLTLEFLDEELLREFIWEDHRRIDNIRFGKFSQAKWEQPAHDKSKEILPIPELIMNGNPNLVQNPGY